MLPKSLFPLTSIFIRKYPFCLQLQSNEVVSEYNSRGLNLFGDIKAVAKDLFSGRGQFSTLQAPLANGIRQPMEGISNGGAKSIARGQHHMTTGREGAPQDNPPERITQTSGQATSETEYILSERPENGRLKPAKDALTQPSASDLSASSLATLSRLEEATYPDENKIMSENPIYHNSFPNINDAYVSPTGLVKLENINAMVKKSIHKMEPVTQYIGPLAKVSYLTSVALAGKALDFLTEPLSHLWSNAYGKGYIRTTIPEAEPSGGPIDFLRMREIVEKEAKLTKRDRQLLEKEPEDYLAEANHEVEKSGRELLSESRGRRQFSTLSRSKSKSDIPQGSGAIPPFSRNVAISEAEFEQGSKQVAGEAQKGTRDAEIPNAPGQIYSKPETSSDPASRQLSGIEYTQETIRAPESAADVKSGKHYLRSPTAQGAIHTEKPLQITRAEIAGRDRYSEQRSTGAAGTGYLGPTNLERDLHQPFNITEAPKNIASTGSSVLSGTVIGRSNTQLAWIGYTPRVDSHGREIEKEPIHYTILETGESLKPNLKKVEYSSAKDSTPAENPFVASDAIDAPLSVRYSHIDGHIPSSRACIHDLAKAFPEVPEFDALTNIRTEVLVKAGTKSFHPRHFEGKMKDRFEEIPTSTHVAHLIKEYGLTDKHASWSVGGLTVQEIIGSSTASKAGTKTYKFADDMIKAPAPVRVRIREAMYDPEGKVRFGATAQAKKGNREAQAIGEVQDTIEGVSLKPPVHGLMEDVTKTEGYYHDLEEVQYLGPQSIQEIESMAEANPSMFKHEGLHPAHTGNVPPKYREMDEAKQRAPFADTFSGKSGRFSKSVRDKDTSRSSRRHFSTATPVLTVGKTRKEVPQVEMQLPKSDAYFTEYQFRVLATELPDLEEHETQLYEHDEGIVKRTHGGKGSKKKDQKGSVGEKVGMEASANVHSADNGKPKSKKRPAGSPKQSQFGVHTESDEDRMKRMGNEYGKGYGYGNGQGSFDAGMFEYAEYGAFSYNALEPENMHQFTLMQKEKEWEKEKEKGIHHKSKQAAKLKPSRYSKESEFLKGISESNLRNVSGKKRSAKSARTGQPSYEELHAEYTEANDADWVGDVDRESVRRYSPGTTHFEEADTSQQEASVFEAGVTSQPHQAHSGPAATRRHYHTMLTKDNELGRSRFHTSSLSMGQGKLSATDTWTDKLHGPSIEEIASEKWQKVDATLPKFLQSKIGHRVGFFNGRNTLAESELPGEASDQVAMQPGKHGKVEHGLVYDPSTKTWWRRRPDGGEEFAYYDEKHSDPSDPNLVYKAVAGEGSYGPDYASLSHEEIVMREYTSKGKQTMRERGQRLDSDRSKEGSEEHPWYDMGLVSDKVQHPKDSRQELGGADKSLRDSDQKEVHVTSQASYAGRREYYMTGSRIDSFPPDDELPKLQDEVKDQKKHHAPHPEGDSTKGWGFFSKPEKVTGSKRRYHTSAIAFSGHDPSSSSRQPKLSPLPLEYIATEDYSGGYGAPWQPGRGPLNIAQYDSPEASGSSKTGQTQTRPLTPQYHIFDDEVKYMDKPRKAREESKEHKEQRKKRVVSMLNPFLQIPRHLIYGVPEDRDPMVKQAGAYVEADKVENVGEQEDTESRRSWGKGRRVKSRSLGTSFREILRGTSSGTSDTPTGDSRGKLSHHNAMASESRDILIGETLHHHLIPDRSSRISVHPEPSLEEELQSHFHAVEMWHNRPEKEANRRIDPVAEHISFDGFNYDTKPREGAGFEYPEDDMVEKPIMPHANEEGFLIDDSDRQPRDARLVHREEARPPSWMPPAPRAPSTYSLPRSTLAGRPIGGLEHGKRYYSMTSSRETSPLSMRGLFQSFQPIFMTQKHNNGALQPGRSDCALFSTFLASHLLRFPRSKSSNTVKRDNINPEANDYLSRVDKESIIAPAYYLNNTLVEEPPLMQSRISQRRPNDSSHSEHHLNAQSGDPQSQLSRMSFRVPESSFMARARDASKTSGLFYPLETYTSSEIRSALHRARHRFS